MRSLLFAAAAALALSSGAALAATGDATGQAGGGNGGTIPPRVSTNTTGTETPTVPSTAGVSSKPTPSATASSPYPGKSKDEKMSQTGATTAPNEATTAKQ